MHEDDIGAVARAAYDARELSDHEIGTWPAFRDGHAAGLASARLAWSAERPTVPGWYWVLGPGADRGRPALINGWDLPIMALSGCKFAGPIPEPAEPAPSPAPPLETEREWDNRRDRLGRDL